MTKYLAAFLSLFGFLCFPIYAYNIFLECSEECERIAPNRVYLGPELYHVKRTREGGTSQHGTVFGGRLNYDYIKRYNFYVGADAFYSTGTLNGTSASDAKLRSHFHDEYFEGRAGYTLQQKCGRHFSLTPFVGGGYAAEKNDFVDPSPLPIHFKISYSFVCAGFLSEAFITPKFLIGLNFKTRYLIDPKNKVSNDPDNDPVTMNITQHFQYRIDLPLTYNMSEHCLLCLVPFWEYRHYGHHFNFPFDFLDTKLKIYGVTFKLAYCW